MGNMQTEQREVGSHAMARRLMNPTSDIFTRYVTLEADEHVLLLNVDDPAFARWVLDQVGEAAQVTALHPSYRALRSLGVVRGLNLGHSVYPLRAQHNSAQAVMLDIPKGRDQVRAYLWTAAQALQPGGHLYLAGSNAAGAKSAIKDAEALFGTAVVLGFKSSRRIALATRPESPLQVPSAWRTSQPWQPQMRMVRRPEGDYTIVTMPGVFSWDHLDDGTELLLDHLDVEPDTDVLDMGCGYGIIGLAAARAGARVTMVDDDLLAVRCAETSTQINEFAQQAQVFASDVTSSLTDHEYDLVLSNPPFHQGVDVNTSVAERIIRESYAILRPGGRLRIVANRFLPYDRSLRDVFGNMTVIVQNQRYSVLESVRDV